MKNKKPVAFSLTDDVVEKLKKIAEKKQTSMSQEIRRLILEEFLKIDKKVL